MKKFFSIVCALAIVLSASAVPARMINGLTKMSKDDLTKQQVEKVVTKKAAPQKFSAVKRIGAAKLDTYNVTIEEYQSKFYEDDNDWYFQMYDATGDYAFELDVVLPAGETTITLGQTYTNMLLQYTGAYQYDENQGEYVKIGNATAASFLMTADAAGLVRIEASMTVGGDIYNLVYQEEPLPVATDTIEVVFTTAETELADYTAKSGVFQFVGANANYLAYAAFYGNQLVGTYSGDQLYLDYTSIYTINGTDTARVKLLAGDAEVTFANDIYTLSAYYIAQDAHCYHVTMAYYEEPFVPTGDTIDVVITDPMTYSYYASQGDWWMRGENAEYAVKIDVVNNDSTSPAGVYAEDSLVLASYTYLTRKADNTKLAYMALEAVVTDANNRIDLVANMLCDDGNVYHITMFYQAPEAQVMDTIVATDLEIEEETIMGYVFGYSATASDANYAVELSLNTDADGTYDAKGYITAIATGDESKIYSGSITLATAADGSKTIVGDVLCMNSVQYHLDLSYTLPEPERTETITGSGQLVNYVDDGVWQAKAVNAAQDRAVMITMQAAQVAGTYTAADLYGGKYYTYVVSVNGADTTYYLNQSFNATVTVANKKATITGSMLTKEYEGTEVVLFNFELTCAVEDYVEPSGNEYDAETSFIKKFPTYTVDDQYLAQYQVLVVEAADATDNSVISLEFNVAEGVTELTPGTYPINETYAENTFSAGAIDDYIYGSFAGYETSQGIQIPLWLLVSGNVTVLANGVIEVNAQNTKGASILVRLGTYPEAIENTEAVESATKRLVNGQLVIEKNGVKYNAVGTILK